MKVHNTQSFNVIIFDNFQKVKEIVARKYLQKENKNLTIFIGTYYFCQTFIRTTNTAMKTTKKKVTLITIQ